MAEQLRNFTSFNAGELSPKLDARIDIAKYQNGCRELKNCIAGLYGEAERRMGLEYIAGAKNNDRKSRLIEWEFSSTTVFTLEFGHNYIRFFSSRAQVLSGGSPYEISTVYTEDEIFDLQFTQINDVAYITHPDHPVQKLTRIANTNWTIADVEFNVPPMLDENITTTTITPSGTTGSITLTASAATFEAGHVGSYWRVAHLRESNFVERNITANATSSTIPILGDWNVRTYGVWSADILIQRSLDGGSTWNTIRKFSGKEDRNVDSVGEQEFEALFRVKIENYAAPSTAGATTPRVVIEAVDNYIYGLAKITAFTSSTVVDATVITDFYATTASTYWQEGAWSDVRGYPRAVTIYNQRIVYGGTNYRRQTVWGSVTGDYENFLYGSGDTDAFAFTIGSKRSQTILWFVAQKALMIGTTSGEWAMMGGADNDPITPTSVQVYPQSEHGSSTIAAKLVGDVVLFVQRNNRKIRELTFSFEKDKYVAPDLTTLANHITKSGIVQIAAQQLPINVLWAVTTDGRLLSMTYEREQDVVGWTEHTTDGFVESVAVSFGDPNDEVWCVVRRNIQGGDKRYIEAMKPAFDPDEGDLKQDAFFVDSGLTFSASDSLLEISGVSADLVGNVGSVYTYEILVTTNGAHGLTDGDMITISGQNIFGIVGEHAVDVETTSRVRLLKPSLEGDTGPYTSATDGTGDYFTFNSDLASLPNFPLPNSFLSKAVKTISGLDHLKGEEVHILADGAVHRPLTVDVSSGSIQLDTAASVVHVGLPYTSRIKPMRLDVNPTTGVSQGQKKRITEIYARLLNSLGLMVGDGETMDEVTFRSAGDPMDDSPPLFTGDKEISFDGGYDYAGDIVIEQTQPLPMTVLGITAKYEVTG